MWPVKFEFSSIEDYWDSLTLLKSLDSLNILCFHFICPKFVNGLLLLLMFHFVF